VNEKKVDEMLGDKHPDNFIQTDDIAGDIHPDNVIQN